MSINASFYLMIGLLPGVSGSSAFQPAQEWVLAVLWCGLDLVVLGRHGIQMGKKRA